MYIHIFLSLSVSLSPFLSLYICVYLIGLAAAQLSRTLSRRQLRLPAGHATQLAVTLALAKKSAPAGQGRLAGWAG